MQLCFRKQTHLACWPCYQCNLSRLALFWQRTTFEDFLQFFLWKLVAIILDSVWSAVFFSLLKINILGIYSLKLVLGWVQKISGSGFNLSYHFGVKFWLFRFCKIVQKRQFLKIWAMFFKDSYENCSSNWFLLTN